MKRLLILLLALLALTLLTSCEDACDITTDITVLEKQRTELQLEVNQIDTQLSNKEKEISDKDSKLKEMNIYLDGDEPLHVLSIELSQSHFSLDISEHIKDAMNSIEFDMPVDKNFYNEIKIGDEILDDFRMGSFIMNGSFGDWEMKVKNKKIIKN